VRGNWKKKVRTVPTIVLNEIMAGVSELSLYQEDKGK